MVQTTDHLAAGRASDARIIGTVGAAHFVSHFYILILPPLFGFVRADYDVSYTELGFALVAFNIVTAACQTPAGFLVDRFGARTLLVAGLLVGSSAFAVTGLVDSFWVMVAMFGLAGLGNAIYHPADYAILSHSVSPAMTGKAYSIHTFAGMLGSAAAPASLLLMQTAWGWRGALIGAAALGLMVAALLAAQPGEPATAQTATRSSRKAEPAGGWQLLLSAPILLNFVLFTLLALINAGLQNYSVVALGALYGTPAATANAALSGYLLLGAAGVLAGGLLVARISGHAWFAALGVIGMAVATLPIVVFDLCSLILIGVISIAGLFYGVIMPSRDLLVRAMTPPGAFGKVFGFVTTGFNVAGIVSPMIFGLVMDHGSPRLVFVLVIGFCLLAVMTVLGQRTAPPLPPQQAAR